MKLWLRRTLRETWARQVSQSDFKSRTVFVIGSVESQELSLRLDQERLEHSDLLRGDFLDSYRHGYYCIVFLEIIIYFPNS